MSKTFNGSKQLSVADHSDHDISDLHPGIFSALKLTFTYRGREIQEILRLQVCE